MIYPRIRIFRHYISRASLLLVLIESAMLLLLAHVLLATQTSAVASAQAGGIAGLSWFAVAIALICVVIFLSLGLYNRTIIPNIQVMMVRFCIGLAIVAIVTYLMIKAYLGVIPAEKYPPDQYYYLPTAIMLGVAALLCTRILFLYVSDLGVLRQRIVMIGSRELANTLQSSMIGDQALGFEIGAVMDPDIDITDRAFETGRGPNSVPIIPLETDPAAMSAVLVQFEADELVIALDDDALLPTDALLDCKLRGIRVTEYLSFVEREMGRIDLARLDPKWFIFSDGFREGIVVNIVQRSLDILVSSAIVIFAAPIIGIIALLIKLDSKGGAFYRQERTGRHGDVFTLLKFRSMTVVDTSGVGPRWAEVDDDRITGMGYFIRQTRIDEIPQIFNVLRGDMSIIGPRPERPFFVNSLSQHIPHYKERHRVRPGITGWAQINYPYGASVEDARERLAYDLYYVKNRSLFLDIVILLQTVRVVLWPSGQH
ncbi:MAG: TIGR03013 family PEP-CTERM/XrtA system glycosyltransferase [Rhodospirillaceae bacterium]|nr:TIGR03013 family PEP-CTERM/XrtA system glycosyltransferase [Rhodospirillaceae bacterium]